MAAIHSDEFKRDAVRIATRSKDQKTIRGIVFPEDGLTRRQVASDLGIGHSPLGKWVKMVSDEAGPPDPDQNLLRENERLRRENRILKEEWELLKRPLRSSRPKSREVRVSGRLWRQAFQDAGLPGNRGHGSRPSGLETSADLAPAAA